MFVPTVIDDGNVPENSGVPLPASVIVCAPVAIEPDPENKMPLNELVMEYEPAVEAVIGIVSVLLLFNATLCV